MQKVTLIGNLGRDPEERFTSSGKRIITLSLAVQSGKDSTVWYELSIWEDRIPMFKGMLPHLKKGSRLLVMGDLGIPHCYMSKTGDPKVSLKVTPFSLSFMSSGSAGSEKSEATIYPQGNKTPSFEERPLEDKKLTLEDIMGTEEVPF
jgi:single-strand DNA-binding protein